MARQGIRAVLIALAVTSAAAADWNLGGRLDRVVAYTGGIYEEFVHDKDRYRGLRGGLLMRCVWPKQGGGLRAYSRGMSVGGEIKRGQFLLAGARVLRPACAEFAILGGSRMTIEYGLCDLAKKRGNEGSLLRLAVFADGREVHHERIRIDKSRWQSKTLKLPKAKAVRVRLCSSRLNFANTNWTGLVVAGDGTLASRKEVVALSPVRDKLGRFDAKLEPSPYRVTARKGCDILFYRDKPFLSYAGKGHGSGAQALQADVGINTYYVEGASFARYWPEGAKGVTVPPLSTTVIDLKACQQFNMPFKTAMSFAHSTPFLPAWLVKKEGLGFTDHKMRRGGATHASIFKSKTLDWYKQGLRGWVKPFVKQPSIFVFSQEDVPEDLDDQAEEAKGKWRAWLRKRFGDRLDGLKQYVGGAPNCRDFEQVPYPKRFRAVKGVGYPMRLSYLKLMWVQETFGDFLAAVFAFMRKLTPGVPLTQRYVNSPFGVYVSRRVGSDYNYTFGHLSTEDYHNRYAVGAKPWVGIFCHCGTLPFPRGGSIGITPSLKIRRGPMTEQEWGLNAYGGVANGNCGFEYSPVFPTWGPQWVPAALFDKEFKINTTGRGSKKVMGELLNLSRHMMRYERHEDVAVFHDAPFNARRFGGKWSQSKAGVYTLIRETGFHPDVLTCWDMTAEKLKGKKVLVLGGTLSIAPEIQDAVREYVRDGGTLVTIYCAEVGAFPGANGYGYGVRPRESAAAANFESPHAAAHLGDVLGIHRAGPLTTFRRIRSKDGRTVDLAAFDELVAKKVHVDKPACCRSMTLAPGARVTATFENGSAAVIENRFGRGRAVTFAFDIGLVANNVTIDSMYQWWSDLLTSLNCRKAVDTKNWRVFGGAWRDDKGTRVVFLVNLDRNRPQTATLPNARKLRLAPGASEAVVLGK